MFAALLLLIPAHPGSRAGDGNRTHVACLEGRYSTIELHPRLVSIDPGDSVFSIDDPSVPESLLRGSRFTDPSNRTRHGWSRIRTCEGIATRFTVWPLWPLGYPPEWISAPAAIDPAAARTQSLQSHQSGRAGGETRTHNPRFTKPMLCRLSYASGLRREIVYITRSRPAARLFPAPQVESGVRSNHERTTSAASQLWPIIPRPASIRQVAASEPQEQARINFPISASTRPRRKPSFRRSASERCFVPLRRAHASESKESPRSDAPRRNGVCAAPRRA